MVTILHKICKGNASSRVMASIIQSLASPLPQTPCERDVSNPASFSYRYLTVQLHLPQSQLRLPPPIQCHFFLKSHYVREISIMNLRLASLHVTLLFSIACLFTYNPFHCDGWDIQSNYYYLDSSSLNVTEVEFNFNFIFYLQTTYSKTSL